MNDFRICPGRYFAMASLFINVASVLHMFDITPALDADGRPAKIKHSQTPGFISYVPFSSQAGIDCSSWMTSLAATVTRKTVDAPSSLVQQRPQR